MNLNKALWEKGDFTRIAATMRGEGARVPQRVTVRLVETPRLPPPQRAVSR